MTTREVRELVKGPSLWKIAFPARRLVSSVALLGCLLINTTAHAIPIGAFNWGEHTQDECGVGLCGAFFFVNNFSTDPEISLGALGDTFFNVSVGLQTDGGPLSLLLGDIAPGNSSQSIDDLFGTTIETAALTLTFGLPQLPGSIQLLDERGNVVTGLTAPGSLLIDYAAPVPEPSTLLLLFGGLSVLAYARWTRPKPLVVRPADSVQRSGESQ